METLIDKNISKEGEYSRYTLLAAGATWNDNTSYSRDERGKKQPNAFELDLKVLRIFITSNHIHYKGTWIMGCHQLNLERVECLNCKTATEAAEYAVKVVKHKLSKMNEALSTFH